MLVKDDSDELQTFTNTILALGWRDAGVEVDEVALAYMALTQMVKAWLNHRRRI